MFIEEFPNAVAPETCAKIIDCFERDPERRPSAVIAGSHIQAHENRSGTQLALTRKNPEWEGLFMAVVPALRATMEKYIAKHKGLSELVECEGLDCTLPMIERVDPGQGFTWHYDNTATGLNRVVAGLLYLKTIKDGGETEFWGGHKVRPEAGKIALFPPYWTHLHRGVTPAREPKYVLSYFWIYPTPKS